MVSGRGLIAHRAAKKFDVNLRSKLLILFLAGILVPVLLAGLLLYRNSLNVVEGMLREEIKADAARAAHDVEAALRAREVDLNNLAQASEMRDYVRNVGAQPAAATGNASPASDGAAASVPEAVQAAIADFISQRRDDYSAVTLVSAPLSGRTPFRVRPPDAGDPSARVAADDPLPGQLPLDERVWTTSEPKPLRSNVTRGANGTPCIVYTVPVFSTDNERSPRVALVAELKLDALLQETGHDSNVATSTAQSAPARAANAAQLTRLLFVLDKTGQIVHHTNYALKYQPASVAMPYFDTHARSMQAGSDGTDFYTVPADGSRWLVSYKPIPGSDLSVAAAGNYTRAVAGLKRDGLTSLMLALLVAGAITLFVFVIVTRATRRISRVTEAAAAIGAGDLNQRIEVEANDETHALAEGFNRMSDRLRELIAREAEMRQFQSFVRLSAMLTHDLKNAITGLSMLVTNMERQFHRAEFREDAVSSLRQATEKLSALVARLSEPVRTLSGEYRRTPQPADLIPVIRRVLATTAAPRAEFYDIQTELPDTLVAPIDAERIERVVENLIVNAFEAMGGRGGRLTVAAGEESDTLVYFSVEDTGPGMTEDFMHTRLFHPFATTKKRGIGLGLYTCREIVESHGGRLEVKSKLGSGTRFRVVLPSIPLMASHARSVEKSSLAKAAAKTGAAS
ncbi:MAG TPA: ATP-binding protein [Pyrinomonadaceae bacterium]|nr:ATP-binding protein [Pyrinomonadaceae bacterium]